jgi:L-ascorbate metabolism protein UlaG (beta-lactamase superfamily)
MMIRKAIKRIMLAMLALFLLGTAVGLAMSWEALGRRPGQRRAARMAASPNWADGAFVNKQPLWNDIWGSIASAFSMSEVAVPNAPLPLEALKDVDVVLISHDHYDHLDQPTIARMRDRDVTFITPLGVGAHLEYWGISPACIVELDWWQEHKVDDLRIIATPARHASGRHLLDQNRTLWAGYALIGPERPA